MSVPHSSRHCTTPRNTGNPVKVARKRDEVKGQLENQNIKSSSLQRKSGCKFEEACNVDLITLPPQQQLAHNADKTKYY
ncbi:hypothetical protein CR513_19434, partial [Mucuna pruriens]